MRKNEGLIGRIQECLHEKNKSVRSLSLESTGSPDTIANIIMGRTYHPRSDTLWNIANALGVRAEWLFSGASPKTNGGNIIDDDYMGFLMENGQILSEKLGVEIPPKKLWKAYKTLYDESYKPDMTDVERKDRLEGLERLIKYASL